MKSVRPTTRTPLPPPWKILEFLARSFMLIDLLQALHVPIGFDDLVGRSSSSEQRQKDETKLRFLDKFLTSQVQT